METENGILNRVASSGIRTLDLEDFYVPGTRVLVDISAQLYEGMILKEKSFRDFIKTHDWSQYHQKLVAVTCSTEAIIPTWAYMLLATALQPFAATVVFGSLEQLEEKLYYDALAGLDWENFRDAKVVIKGCSKVPVPTAAYVEATRRLRPIASSIMFGEPCSTVPVYKRPRI